MCRFLSALVLPSGEVLTHPMLDSHADLVTRFKLRDEVGRFAKVELVPGEDWLDPWTWTLHLDEPTAPEWWDRVAEQAESTLRTRAEAMVLRDGEHRLIIDGCWIVGGTAKLYDVRGGRIVCVRDSARISHVGDSAQITNVGDSAQISDVWGSAQISDVRGSAQITSVRGSATLDAAARAHVV